MFDSSNLWRSASSLTVVQAALLVVGADPACYQERVFNADVTKPAGFLIIHSLLIASISSGEVEGVSIFINPPNLPFGNLPNWSFSTIKVDGLKKWLLSRGIESPFFFSESNVELLKLGVNNGIEQETYISRDLSLVNEAARQFWSTAIPEENDTHPINTEVSDWLVKKGMSKSSADQAATIIRPEWAVKGRR